MGFGWAEAENIEGRNLVGIRSLAQVHCFKTNLQHQLCSPPRCQKIVLWMTRVLLTRRSCPLPATGLSSPESGWGDPISAASA